MLGERRLRRFHDPNAVAFCVDAERAGNLGADGHAIILLQSEERLHFEFYRPARLLLCPESERPERCPGRSRGIGGRLVGDDDLVGAELGAHAEGPKGLRAVDGHAAPAVVGMPIGDAAAAADSCSSLDPDASAATAEGRKPLNMSHRPSESSHRKIGGRTIPDNTETCSFKPRIVQACGNEEQRGSDESQRRDDSWHEARPKQHPAQQQRVQAGHDPGSEQERRITDRDEPLADRDQRGRVGSGIAAVLPDGHESKDAQTPTTMTPASKIRVVTKPMRTLRSAA